MEGTLSEAAVSELAEVYVCVRAAAGRGRGDGGVGDDGMVGDLDLAGGEPGTDSPGVLPADGLEAMVRTGIGFTQCRRSLTTGSMTRRRHPSPVQT